MAQFLNIFVILLGVHISHQADPIRNPINEIEDNSRYKTLEANATLLKLLVNNKTGVSRSEVFDMLHSRDDNVDHVDVPSFPQDTDDAKPALSTIPDFQAEYLQEPGQMVRKDNLIRLQPSPTGRVEPVGVAAIIMVVITCFIIFSAYAAIIIWRRIELKRNGLKHELLRNEDNVAETRIEL